MAYKRKSPLNNKYSDPQAVAATFANTTITPIDFSHLTSADGVSSGDSDPIPTNATDLKGQKKDYPKLQAKLKNAKNEKQRQKVVGKINKKTTKHHEGANRKKARQGVNQAIQQRNQKKKTANVIDRQRNKINRKKGLSDKDVPVLNKPTTAPAASAGTSTSANVGTPSINPGGSSTLLSGGNSLNFINQPAPILNMDQLTQRIAANKDFKLNTNSPFRMKTPLNYLNPNTLEVQGDAGQVQDPAQQAPDPNRAGRPINSNVLMNDPTNYQDPSKISAQQNQQQQLFSGLASSAGTPNPEPMIPGQDPNQSITPGQQSPFNKNGDPDKIYQAKDIPQTGSSILPELTVTPNYNSVKLDMPSTNSSVNEWGNEQKQMKRGQRLVEKKVTKPTKGLKQMKRVVDVPNTTDSTAAYMQNTYDRDFGPGTKGNWSDIAAAAEKRYPGLKKAVGTNIPKGPDGNIYTTDYNVKKGREKYNLSPLKKTGWIQEATADIKRRGTEGVCTGDKFGGPGCPPGSKRYNLAKTFKKMAKKR